MDKFCGTSLAINNDIEHWVLSPHGKSSSQVLWWTNMSLRVTSVIIISEESCLKSWQSWLFSWGISTNCSRWVQFNDPDDRMKWSVTVSLSTCFRVMLNCSIHGKTCEEPVKSTHVVKLPSLRKLLFPRDCKNFATKS